MADKPNILFLSADSLRVDRLSLHGYERPTTPNLDRLAQEAIVCDENIACTAFTQPSLPSMLTSSLPLSCGGYDTGARGRPPTLFKTFNDAGYETSMISTFPWVNRFYGYGDGVSHEQLLFVINALVGVASQTMASSLNGYRTGAITEAAMLDIVVPVVTRLFNDLLEYCDLRLEQAEIDSIDMRHERLMKNGYDYPRVQDIVRRHRRIFLESPLDYIQRHLKHPPAAHQWIAHEWRLTRAPGALLEYGLERAIGRILKPFWPTTARLMEYRRKRYVDAHALADRIIRTIDSRDKQSPFLLWAHFFDCHIPYCPGVGANWHREAKTYLAALGYPTDIDPSVAVIPKPTSEKEWIAWRALYDAAVLYVDEQIGRVVNAIESRGLSEDTLIVIASDHGEELGDHGDISHHFRLYEHNIRVPLMFSRPGIAPRRIKGLTSLLDLPPTIADLTGVSSPPQWMGTSVISPSIGSRTHVLAEAFHGGNCLFGHRPPYIAVRTDRFKYLWKEYRDPGDRFSDPGPELYDHRMDPQEKNNLYRSDHPALPLLQKVVADRLADIPEISSDRIVSAFGTIGERAVAARHMPTSEKTVR